MYTEQLVDGVIHSQSEVESAELQFQDGQVDFLINAFGIASKTEYCGRWKVGPRFPSILEVLEDTAEKLTAIGPSLTPQHLFPSGYASRSYENRTDKTAWRLQLLAEERIFALRALGASYAESETRLPNFRLNSTPFRYQGEGRLDSSRSTRLCFGACFRMVYEAITGEEISEITLARALTDNGERHTDLLVDDEVYLNTLGGNELRQRHGATIRVVSLTGARLETIAQIQQAAQRRNPQTRIYGVVALQSEVRYNIWHTNVLLGAREQRIMVHDPTTRNPQANRELTRAEFESRWSVALNRAHLILASPEEA